MKDDRVQPTTQILGAKASQLLKELATENGVKTRYFFTTLLIREARAEATMLTAEKLKNRLALIDEVVAEQVDLINDPPKCESLGIDYSTKPKTIYAKIWEAHRRLTEKGWGEEEIHDYCLKRYGMDIDITKNPNTSPKKNPNWVGGGKVAAKIKQAKEVSRKLEQ